MALPMMIDRRGPEAVPQKKILNVYTLANCSFCQRAKMLLEQYQIAYVEHAIDGDEAMRLQVIERSGGRMVLPQLFINDNHLGGFFELKRHCQEGSLPLLMTMG